LSKPQKKVKWVVHNADAVMLAFALSVMDDDYKVVRVLLFDFVRSFLSTSLWMVSCVEAIQCNSNLVAVFLRFEADEVVSRHLEAEP
jgi:hypothetical protein